MVPEAAVRDRFGVMSFTQAITDMDQVYANGLLLLVYTADPSGAGFNQLFYTVIDVASKVTVVPSQRVDLSQALNASGPKLSLCGTVAVLTYVDANLEARSLNMANVAGGWTSATTIANDGVGSFSLGVYDAGPVAGDPTRFAIAYQVSNGGNNVAIRTFAVAGFGLLHSEFDETTFANLQSITVVATSGEVIWAIYSGDNGGGTSEIRAWAYGDVSHIHASPFIAYTFSGGQDIAGRLVGARIDATDVMAVWSPFVNLANSDAVNISRSYVGTVQLSTAPAVVGNVRKTFGVLVRSRPIVVGAVAYLAVQYPSVEQGTTFLTCIDYWSNPGALLPMPLRNVATLNPRLAKTPACLVPNGSAGQTAPNLVNLTAIATAVYGVPSLENTSPTHQAIYEYPVDLAANLRYGSAELYELEAIAAGCPSVFDGQSVVELGFAWYPMLLSVVYSGTGGAMQTSGVYQYVAVYEWYDARGQIHRSAVSDPATFTATGSGNTGSVTLSVTTLSLTSRRQMSSGRPAKYQPYIVLYRTQANGTVFYRVTMDPPPSTAQNTLNASVVGFSDTLSDSAIATSAFVYTTGGFLENFNPPAGRILVAHRNRWWVAGCPDPTALWPTKELTTGEAPGFNEAMNFTCTGAIRALASMDDKLVVFVQRGSAFGIECITGEGPTDAGTASDWTPPQQVPSDCGAVDQRGVCVGPFGVLFRSTVGGPTGAGGIFLLSRDLQVTYVSGPVEDTFSNYPSVTSMVLHPNAGRVYITCTNDDVFALQGVRLVWDDQQGGIWSTDTLTDVVGGIANVIAGARCAFVANTASAGMGTSGPRQQATSTRKPMEVRLRGPTWTPARGFRWPTRRRGSRCKRVALCASGARFSRRTASSPRTLPRSR